MTTDRHFVEPGPWAQLVHYALTLLQTGVLLSFLAIFVILVVAR